MAISNEITTTINGNVKKLIAISHLDGNVINNGTIYLIATYEAYQKINGIELSLEEFKSLANSYMEKLRKVHGFVNFLGFPEEILINDFYIYPRIVIPSDFNFSNDAPFDVEINPTNLPLFTSYEETFIYGPAGSGKSTFLKYIISNIIDYKINAVPVFISLPTFQAKWRINFNHTLYDQILHEFKQYGFQKSFVDFMLQNSETILLLDGFDEAYKNEDEKQLLIENIASYKKIFDTEITRVIITSRTKDYDFANPKRKNVELLPFNKEQINLFLEKRLVDKGSISNFLESLRVFYNSTFEDRNQSDTPEKDWAEDRNIILSKKGLLPSDVYRYILENKIYPKILSSPQQFIHYNAACLRNEIFKK